MKQLQGLRAAARRRGARHGRQADRRRHAGRLRRLRRPRRRTPATANPGCEAASTHIPNRRHSTWASKSTARPTKPTKRATSSTCADWNEDIGKVHGQGRERAR
ncbi:MAG: hypothetical protein MZV65_15245 [Chromatiales bacterium]|nr:hypothetical protein [Chromatiales bacterium]